MNQVVVPLSSGLPPFETLDCDDRTVADLRSDHAGETGAVAIYRGILAISRDAEVRQFAEAHLATESDHLALLQLWLPAEHHSRLLGLWRAFGWSLGAIAALGPPAFTYATIAAVETFVIEHYAEQLPHAPAGLRPTLTRLMNDEAEHQQDAAGRTAGQPGALLNAWIWIVGTGSALAVAAARRL